LPLDMQVKLLRVLQEQEFEPVGSSRTVKVDVRVIAATNRVLEQEVTAGRFRADLFYRLNVLPVRVPSLRERSIDIPQLVMFFVQRHAKRIGRNVEGVSRESMDRLMAYPWPGNVRELENVIERAVVVCDGSVIREQHFPDTLKASEVAPTRQLSLGEAVASLERRLITEALSKERGNVARAARALGTSERVIRYKASKYEIDTGSFRNQ